MRMKGQAMKLGILSDIHANPYALEAALSFMKKERVDKVICDGDIVGYSPLVNETFEILRNEKIECVLGNHDFYVLNECPSNRNDIVKECINKTKKIIREENIVYLKSLRKKRLIYFGDIIVKMVHGSPFNELEEYIYPDKEIETEKYCLDSEDFLVLGHTHHQMLKKSLSTNFFIVNPGSIGQPRDAKGMACFAIFNMEQREIRLEKLQYETKGILRALEKERWPPILTKYF